MTLPRLRTVLLLPCLAALAMPAFAMNWEGHDESLKDVPGIEAFSSGAEYRPLPSRPCPVTPAQAKSNPYEQIPLSRHDCTPVPDAQPETKTR
jgi:hypothetical protein